MIDDSNTINISGGMDVFGSDGEKVGSVAGVEGDYVVVSKGFFFPTDYYIPTSAINSADGEGVYLNVTKDEALNQGWDTAPETTTTTNSAMGVQGDSTYGTDQVSASQGDLGSPGAYADTTTSETRIDTTGDQGLYDRTVDDTVVDNTGYTTTDVNRTDDATIQLSEEELVARTREVERGAVEIDKFVTEQERTLEVPVTEERVRVERRAVDGDVTTGSSTFDEGTIEVPVRGQEVEVDRQSRVVEEIDITKEQEQATRQVSGTVRREDVEIRDNTGTEIDDDTTRRNR